MVFSFADIPSLAGKVVIITGANTGIGKITALEMAKKGAHVILACRSQKKSLPVVEEIKKAASNENVEFGELDLASLASVKKFSEWFLSKEVPLHILINNAGVMACPYGLTQDGIETQFGTNHVGHFYLTMLLLDTLEKSQPSRIVSLSSGAHKFAPSEGILFGEPGNLLSRINNSSTYGVWSAYGQSKLSNLLFAAELDRKLKAKGIEKIYVNSLHPGNIRTELSRHIVGTEGLLHSLYNWVSPLFQISPEKGAITQLYCATSPEIEEKSISGRYFIPYAQLATPSTQGSDETLASKLWDFTDAILKEKLGDSYTPKFAKESK